MPKSTPKLALSGHNKKKPNPVDIHIGSRVRLRRQLLGISQEELGKTLSISFQQVQKYEKGTNRIGGSRMQQIAIALRVPVAHFYEGLPSINSDDANEADAAFAKFATDNGAYRLIKAFVSLDSNLRRAVIANAEALAGTIPVTKPAKASGRRHLKAA